MAPWHGCHLWQITHGIRRLHLEGRRNRNQIKEKTCSPAAPTVGFSVSTQRKTTTERQLEEDLEDPRQAT